MIIGLTVFIYMDYSDDSNIYTTMSSPPDPHQLHDNIYNVIFSPDTTQKEIQLILAEIDAQIIAGPTKAGIYTIYAVKEENAVLTYLNDNKYIDFTGSFR